jgi:hypothetical protein
MTLHLGRRAADENAWAVGLITPFLIDPGEPTCWLCRLSGWVARHRPGRRAAVSAPAERSLDDLLRMAAAEDLEAFIDDLRTADRLPSRSRERAIDVLLDE